MSETPIYGRALKLLAELEFIAEEADARGLSGHLQVELVNTRAIVCSNLAIAEALRARDTLTGSSDERSENG